MRTVAARLAIVPLAAALLLTGCGRPGTAATVDGERITDAQVTRLVDDLSKLTTSAVTPSNALSTMVVSPTILDVAESAGVGVSTAQALELLDTSAAQLQVEPWDYSPELIEYARVGLVSQTLQASPETAGAVSEQLTELDVDVNPRFGSWDAGTLSPASWPWLISAESSAPTTAPTTAPAVD